MKNLLGFAALDAPLSVADVQVLWVLCVEVGHNVHPSEKQSAKRSSASSTYSRTLIIKTEADSYFLQWIAGCFRLGSPIRIQCSISVLGRGALRATR